MNTSQGALYFGAGIDLQQWRRDVDSMRRDILGLGQDVRRESSNMDSAFKNLSIGIAGYFSVGAIKSFVMELINVRGEFQKTEIAFSTMLGNGDKAKVLMGEMVDLAAKTPFSLQDVSSGAKQLLAFQVPADEVVDTLTRMGNIAAGLGVPLSRINLVYGQVKAKGKLAGDDLRQFTEAGIPMVAELAKKFNKTTAEISTMVSAGKIGFKDVQDVLFSMTNEGGMFFDLMEKQSASLSGKIANLGDSWDQMLNKIGEGNEGILNDGIEGINYLVENYQKILDIIESLIVVYGSYKAAVIVAAAAQNFANKTIMSEIALLSISEKMKLGRALVTQRQAEATLAEAQAERASLTTKYAVLQAEVSSLAVKKQKAIAMAMEKAQALGNAQVQLALANAELRSIQANGTAREILIATKNVEKSQNALIAAQESASIARKGALSAATQFQTTQVELKTTATALSASVNAVETGTEVAQTAAKTANAIATARLTFVTTLRTAATQLATAAQALLNATMLNNPIVIVIAAAVALTYAYYRLRDTSTALSIAEKELNDERQRSRKLIDEIKSKTQELTAIINSDTSTRLQQLEAYKQMQAMYPSVLKNMDLETYKKLGATEAQKKLNAELDKFSTQNLKNQIESSKKNIDELTTKITDLNQKLKKRNGDSGIYINDLELATKNLEAQKINLEKYNTELSQRLENEKLSSMNLAQQKKYWEEQVTSINKQVASLEKSNIKKAESIDKLSNIGLLVKRTSLEFINWNINPLLSQLSRAQSEINKINNAQSGVGVDKNKAYWEEQKKVASEANDAMSGRSADPKAWDANINKIREATEQLKKYDYSDRDLLKAQKERDRERKRLEKGAEKSYLEGSVKRYEQQISLLEDALSRSDGKTVRLRYVDKYGKERYSAEIKQVTDVQNEILDLREKRAAREKLIEVKSSEERISESERQWNNYYKMAEFYGKEAAFAQYKDLFQGSQSYIEYLEKQEDALRNLQAQGILTDQQKQDLIFLGEKRKSLTGSETPFENFKRGIDDAIKSIPSLVDQLNYYDSVEQKVFNKEQTNSPEYFQQKKYLEERKREVLSSQKDLYIEFLKEQETFEYKKNEIEEKYKIIRQQIGNNDTYTDTERLRLLNNAGKNETKEISSASFEAFKKTDLWVKAFGDLDKIGPKTLAKLKKGLQDYLKANQGTLQVIEIKETQDQIKKLDDLMTSNNPYKAIGVAVDLYKKKRQELNEVEKKSGKNSDEYQAKLEETNQAFSSIVEITGAAAKATIEAVGSIGDAFGGLSDELKQTLAEVQQLIEGIINAVVGYFSGNYGQMISGIVQIVGAMVKLLSGDKGRERQIREWQTAVEDLKTAYDSLQHSISRTAGEAAIAAQRGLVENLEEQKRLVTQMRDEESKKKKADKDKIAGFNSQISQLTQQIEDVFDNFQKSVTTTDFKDLSENIANALIEAFGKGEDAAASFEKVVDDVMKNAVANALRIKILEPAVKSMVDNLYSSMGFGNGNAHTNDAQISKYRDDIAELEKKIKTAESSNYYNPENTKYVLALKEQKQKLLDLIGGLQAQNASTPAGGAFDGLTPEEREKIKAMGTNAMQQYMDALKQYEDLFGASAENAQGLKGDIKGITEKTGGALEGQFNAVRINVVAIFKLMQQNHIVANAQTTLLSQIEVNTRRLHNMDKTLAEMNSKMNNTLAGI